MTIETAIEREADREALPEATGDGADEAMDPGDVEERLRVDRLKFESASRTDYPQIVDLAPEIAGVRAHSPFDRGLEMIIEGLRRRAQAV